MKIAPFMCTILLVVSGKMAFSQSTCYKYIRISVTSNILKEKISVRIFLPESFDKNLRLKSIYVLDGDYLAPVVAASLESLSELDQSKYCLVIAVSSSNRQRDFTPTSVVTGGQMAGAGGADNYLKYLEHELIPMIEKKFNTDPNRIIIGHSIGGLLAYYSILKNPVLFHSIISLDGSLWWNEGRIGKAVIDKLTNTPTFQGRIFECRKDLSQPVQLKPNLELLKYLALSRPPGLMYDYLEIKNATHTSIVYPGIYYGLKAVLSNTN